MIILSGISLPFQELPEAAIDLAKKRAGVPTSEAYIVRRAVDARHKHDIRFVYSVALKVEGGERELAEKLGAKYAPAPQSGLLLPHRGLPSGTPPFRPVVAGFGPAGMFAALYLAKAGVRPIVIERGAPVEQRVRDVRAFFDSGALNEESNVQFGEGGAGTFSDGKLTTRIGDPLCAFILSELARHGAPQEILVDAKPHIGTDLLRKIVASIRGEIISLGGEVRFHTKLNGIILKNGRMHAIETSVGVVESPSLILAPGHSARDTFAVLSQSGVPLSPKPFSVGVRVEHLQKDVNAALYGDFAGHPLLPAAEYKHSLRVNNRAVYTFCMCPGGVVVPAASETGGVVANGMSFHARDAENANAALVVSVDEADFGNSLFGGVNLQRALEQAAYRQAGGGYRAPAQDAGSFLEGKAGLTLGKVIPSYARGVVEGDLGKLFPPKIATLLREGFAAFERKQRGFASPAAVLTGVETRTSSPIRIDRGGGMQSEGAVGLYPCGEGAGYAGGIMSAAVDGMRAAMALVENNAR